MKHTLIVAFAAFSLLLSSTYAADKINLNASEEQLQTLQGVGSTAQSIIEYREASGGFESIDELENVNGIGDKKLQNLSDDVTVSD